MRQVVVISADDEHVLQSEHSCGRICGRNTIPRVSRTALTARSGLNARMCRIDLICKLAGPLFIALIDGASTTVAIWITLGVNIASLPIEYFAIAHVSVRLRVSSQTPC